MSNPIITMLIFLFLCCSVNETSEDKEKNIGQKRINILTKDMHVDTLKFQSFTELISHYTVILSSLENIVSKYTKAGQHGRDSLYSYEKKISDLLVERNHAIFRYITTHDNEDEKIRGLFYLIYSYNFDYFMVENIFHSISAKSKASKAGKLLQQKINNKKEMFDKVGYDTAYLQYKFYDVRGKVVSLSEIPAKYILLDFWASWCAPCRVENRDMMKRKSVLPDSNLVTLVAISLDIDRDRWKKAIRDDNLDCLSLCDFKELQSSFIKEFRVVKIPHNVLIDRNGRILKSNIWGEDLVNFLKSLSDKIN